VPKLAEETMVSGARAVKTEKPPCTRNFHDVHILVEGEFFEAFLIALKKLRYRTQAEFFRAKMREAIREAER